MRTSSSPARSTVALAGEEAAPVADVVRAALLPAEAVAAPRLRARCLALQREHQQLVAAAALLERVLDFVVERGGVHRLLRAAVLGAQSVRGAEHRAQHAARLVAPRLGEPERLLVVLRDEILDVRLDARDHLVRIDGFLGRGTEAEFARRLREDERGKTGCRKDRETLHRRSRIDEGPMMAESYLLCFAFSNTRFSWPRISAVISPPKSSISKIWRSSISHSCPGCGLGARFI